MKEKLPDNPFWTPKRPCVPAMCESCPFKPDGTGLATKHPEFPQIVETVALMGDFYCHQTALMDERTTKNAAGDPSPGFQPHFQQCQGAALYKQGKLSLPASVVKYWKRREKRQ
jgi:hypothetical protein